jgi:hypothetical protein
MTTKNRIIITLVVCAIVAIGVIAQQTKPSLPNEQEKTNQVETDTIKAPLNAPQIHHMQQAEKIDFGPDATHDIGVWPDNGKIHVVVSEKLLQQHGGAELLSKLSLTERDNQLTPAQFQRFLTRLHDALGDDDHDHEHEQK